MSNKSKINSIKWTETLEVKTNFVEKEVEQGSIEGPIKQVYRTRIFVEGSGRSVEQIGWRVRYRSSIQISDSRNHRVAPDVSRWFTRPTSCDHPYPIHISSDYGHNFCRKRKQGSWRRGQQHDTGSIYETRASRIIKPGITNRGQRTHPPSCKNLGGEPFIKEAAKWQQGTRRPMPPP